MVGSQPSLFSKHLLTLGTRVRMRSDGVCLSVASVSLLRALQATRQPISDTSGFRITLA